MEEQDAKADEAFEVEELNENELNDVAGGLMELDGGELSNTNCGCHGYSYDGSATQSNHNCGC